MSRLVVSADDVRAAHRRNELSLPIPAKAIVTPLAREEAAKWGIELAESAGRVGDSDPADPRLATCDPDDVQRIVDRVRARAPGADPAQIREIARRVLEEDAR